MKTEAQLVREIAKASSLSEQMALVEQLDALKQAQARQAREDRELDLSNTVIDTTLSPVLTHTLHTAATDWLGEGQDVPQEAAHQAALAEGALWFQRLDPMVKADREEFAAQAFGFARRVASKFGEHAPSAERSFLDYVAFLQAREAASGLDQIQQTVRPDGVTPGATPLPEDTFDTFEEPVNEFNQGLDDAESSENAPLLNEILQTGPAQTVAPPKPSEHDTTDDYSNSYSEMPPTQSSLAIDHLYTLDDFRREATQQHQADQIPVAARCPDCDAPIPPFRIHAGMIDCQRCGGINPLPAQEKTAAGTHPDGSPGGSHARRCSTPGCEGRVDSGTFDGRQVHGENYDPDQPGKCPSCAKGRGPVKSSAKEAYTADDWKDHVNEQSHTFREEDLPAHLRDHHGFEDGMDTVDGKDGNKHNHDPNGPTHNANKQAAFDDAGHEYGPARPNPSIGALESVCKNCGTNRVHNSDGSVRSVNPYGPASCPGRTAAKTAAKCENCSNGNHTGSNGTKGCKGGNCSCTCGKKEAASSLPQIQQTIDSNNQPATTPLPDEVAFPIVQPWPETSTGGDDSGAQDAIEAAEERGQGQGQAEKPNQHGASLVSASLNIKPETRASKDFRKAYRYAQAWRPGMPLVNTGSAEFEAGIFAGLIDNPQGEQFAQASLATKHTALHTRIKMHASYLAKTAATTVDLDTLAPGTGPDPSGQTPINGPGEEPELEGGQNPAAPGGPAPYNGTTPYGSPVTSNPGLLDPQNSTTTQQPADVPMPFAAPPRAPENGVQTAAGLKPDQAAFRKRVQAGKLADKRRAG